MAVVTIPTPLRMHTDGQASVKAEGSSVGEVLKSLGERYPDLQKRIFKDDGELHDFVNVFVNNEDIRYMDDLATAVAEKDTVDIIPSIAGG